MNIFSLSLEEFEKEIDKVLEGISPEELLNELEKYGLKTKGGKEMREIKFRGKSEKTNEWVYGSLLRDEIQKKYYIVDNESGIGKEVDENTIGQYTSLKDKNGVKIYKGDILKYSDEDTAIVVFNEKYSYFMVKPIQDFYFDSDVLGHTIEYNQVEVIGNVVDNRELLKDGE